MKTDSAVFLWIVFLFSLFFWDEPDLREVIVQWIQRQ